MAYNDEVTRRIRELLKNAPELQEKKMFGGIAFMIRGNLACGVQGDDLIVRVGPENYSQALAQPHTRPFDFSGRPMAGWVYVDFAGIAQDVDLAEWTRKGVDFALSLPSK